MIVRLIGESEVLNRVGDSRGDVVESRGHARGSLVVQRDAVAVEEAGGARRVAPALAALGFDAEVGNGLPRGRDAALVDIAIVVLDDAALEIAGLSQAEGGEGCVGLSTRWFGAGTWANWGARSSPARKPCVISTVLVRSA